MNDTTGTSKNPSLADYYSAIQLRTDRWSSLKSLAVRMDEGASTGDRAALAARAGDLLDSSSRSRCTGPSPVARLSSTCAASS